MSKIQLAEDVSRVAVALSTALSQVSGLQQVIVFLQYLDEQGKNTNGDDSSVEAVRLQMEELYAHVHIAFAPFMPSQERNLDSLGLPGHVVGPFKRKGLHTVGDVLQFESKEDILMIRNLGVRRLQMLGDALTDAGYAVPWMWA